MIRARAYTVGRATTAVVTIAVTVILALASNTSSFAAEPQPDFPPLSPQESMKLTHLHDGYRLELVAAEPLVIDPVAIDFGPDGRLWVAEMADYPLGAPGHGDVGAKEYDKMRPGGRIRVLSDTDGDGRFGKSTVFADKLTMPNGVMVWRDGVLVTSADAVLFLRDTDGDGRADERRELFTGFAVNNPQLRINGLRYGLDHGVYLANGLTTRGLIKSTMTGQTVKLGARDLRIDPDTGAMDPLSGASQFGRNRDDYGNWFGVHNSYPLWHFALDDRYTRRNPHVTMPDPKNYLVLPRNPPVKFRSRFVQRYDHPHRGSLITSTCSAMIYRDALFPLSFHVQDQAKQHAFTCEPYANLVMRFALTEEGVTFKAERVRDEDGYEFLSSEDGWFRPVMVRTGPDGALYVVDMYRYLIEHPQYMPPEGRERLRPFFRLGDDKGRIYRVVPNDNTPRAAPRLDTLGAAELVTKLGHPAGVVRDTAQRLIIERGEDDAIEPLRRLVADSASPVARLHALCTLDRLGALNDEHLTAALGDDHPAVRRHAIRIAEPRAIDRPDLLAAAVILVDDGHAKVRQQLAYTLGQWKGDAAGDALARLALRGSADAYMLASVMSSVGPHLDAVIDAAAGAETDTVALRGDHLMAHAIGIGDRKGAAKLLRVIVTPVDDAYTADQMRSLASLFDLLRRRRATLAKLRGDGKDVLAQLVDRVAAVQKVARTVAHNPFRPIPQRVAAVSLLGRDRASLSSDVEQLTGLINPQTPVEVQRAAIDALLRSGHKDAARIVLRDWVSRGPAMRVAILDGLLGRVEWSDALLDAVDSGEVPAGDIGATHVQRLLKSRKKALREHAERLFASRADSNRAEVVEANADVLKLKGDAASGKTVFAQVCAACHRLDDVGNDVGPNLRSVTDRSPHALLAAILDPNRNVEPRYTAYTALLNDGGALFGVLTAETGGSITITGLDGKPRTVLRSDLKSLRSTGRSLMPDGLEAGLTKQQLADVIRYIAE